jgi:hypothetical protein
MIRTPTPTLRPPKPRRTGVCKAVALDSRIKAPIDSALLAVFGGLRQAGATGSEIKEGDDNGD